MSRVLTLWAGMTGTVLPFAGAAAPADWLLCAGQAVSRTTYATLFAVIGTTYGAGDGSTTFNLPDLRGRVAGGKDDMGGTAAGRLTAAGAGVAGTTLGATGGTQVHSLTTAQMPAHNHAVTDPGHAHGITDPTHAHGVYDPGHTHQYYRVTTGNGQGSDVGTANNHILTNTAAAATGISIYASGTGISVNGAGTGISTQNNGSGGAHNNTQPTIVLNHIIKI
ncbi:tail fibers protein [Serratia phage MQ-4]|nr:tail fibers protein [Serratia phage MQ-4]